MLEQVLAKLAPRTPKAKRDRFIPFLDEALPRYEINTELRLAAFLATICFESDYFKATEEYASGWDYDISKNPRKAKALGNTEKGDGPKYKGRGLIQLTGKSNYRVFTLYQHHTDPDFVVIPQAVAEPKWAVESACWFWQKNNLNKYADKGQFFAVQGLVNRGSATKKALDYDDRLKLYDIALRAIPDDFPGATQASATTPSEAESPILAHQEAKTQAPGFFGSTMDRLAGVKAKFDAIGVDPTSISKPSWFAIIWQKLWAAILAVAAYYWDNPWVLLGTVALLIVGGVLYNNSRKRAREAAKA